MKKTLLVMAMAIALVLGLMSAALANNGNGRGSAPDRTEQSNSLVSESEALTVSEVTPEVGDPNADNFDDQFIYYNVAFEESTFSNWVYREPSRIGSENHTAEFEDEISWDAFWYGVSSPPEIQDEIVHDGTVWQYFETDGGWRHLKADFAVNDFGHGLLSDVNGAAPEGVFGDIEWTTARGVDLRSTFSTAQGKVVTTTVETGTTRSIEVDCTIIDGDEVFLSGTNNEDDPAIFYARGGDDPGIGQWTNPAGRTCNDQWVGNGTFNDGFVEFGE